MVTTTITKRREPVTARRVRGARLVDHDIPPFGPRGAVWDTVRQQEIKNCPLPAILASIARIKPEAIKRIVDMPYFRARRPWFSWMDDETPRRRFKGDHLMKIKFKFGWFVRMSPLLYHWDGKNDLVFAKCTDGSGWASYIEKAYVVLRAQHTYEVMDSGSPNPISVDQIFYDFVGRYHQISWTGRKPEVFLNNDPKLTRGNAPFTQDYLKKFIRRAKTHPTIATTWSTGGTLIGGHTYVVKGLKNNRVQLWEAMRDTSPTVHIRDFFDEFDSVYRARTAP